jgi:DNA-binding NtrC family response regulator
MESKIYKLFQNETAYIISKESGVPKQTVTDLVNGKSDMKKAKFITIQKFYKYAKTQDNA